MRYKFRGKEIDTGKWVYGGLFKEPAPPQCFEKTLEDKYWIVYPNPRFMPDWNLPYQMVRTDVDKETIGQYTGLKDKNGKEIYEGDIIDDGGTIYKVLYYLDGFVAEVIKTKEDKEQIPDVVYALADFDKGCRVIGNIYDNPELLEEGE